MRRIAVRSLLFTTLFVLALADLAHAQQTVTPVSFDERQSLKLEVKQFSDADIARLTRTLDALLASDRESSLTLWNFARQLQASVMTSAQEKRVLAHLDGIAKAYPAQAEAVERAQDMIGKLTIGKMAPEIVGVDLDGAPLRLSDYRGKVVVLIFGAEWCGICRTLYPYERLMLELYRNWPLEVLGVETGSSREAVRDLRVKERLMYRAWWDAPSEKDHGAIASAWNAAGVPTVYLIDERGVIRFVDLRYEDLLKGVRQLLAEHEAPDTRTASNRAAASRPAASPDRPATTTAAARTDAPVR